MEDVPGNCCSENSDKDKSTQNSWSLHYEIVNVFIVEVPVEDVPGNCCSENSDKNKRTGNYWSLHYQFFNVLIVEVSVEDVDEDSFNSSTL